MVRIDSEEKRKQRRLITVWSITFMIVFPFLVILGLLMRLNQAEDIDFGMDYFYAAMTLHGLGMVGILYSIAFAGLWYLLSTRYVKLNLRIGYINWILILIGFSGLVIATMVGKFASGWYLLYPLSFKGASWPAWSTMMTMVSIIILGVTWLFSAIHVIHALAKKYGGIANLLGFQYFKKDENRQEIQPIVLIATVSLLPGILAVIAGGIFAILNIAQVFEASLVFDSLMMKNLVMFFGHTQANIILYVCLGWVYALLPEFTGRPLKTNRILVLGWVVTFFFITFAFFHHMYMDFVQPIGFQYAGQFISYFSAIPATAVTMFSVISQIYRAKIKWGVVPFAFLLGVAGWAIVGFSAVVDSTISMNKVLHNTMWVPAHFHTYLLTGVVLFILGFLFYISHTQEEQYSSKAGKWGFWIFVYAAHTLIAMFFLGGMKSIPRRYSDYKGITIESIHSNGALMAHVAAIFILILLLGLLIMYFSILKRLFRQKTELDAEFITS